MKSITTVKLSNQNITKAGSKSKAEVFKIVESIRKEMEELDIPPYTPRKDGRIL